MKPIIGITTSTELEALEYKVHQDHVQAILKAGGIPFLIPHMTELDQIKQVIANIDGLYLTGGYDIDPTLFGEEPRPGLGTIIPERDVFEMTLIKEFLKIDKPILGVCRGIQMLNIAMGGDMFQDIYSQISRPLLQHEQQAPRGHGSHFIEVDRASLLFRLIGKNQLKVNSRHHQANRYVPNPFFVSGRASDNIIEAIESKEHAFVVGLQWHPENMVAVGDEDSLRIFKGFITACKERKEKT